MKLRAVGPVLFHVDGRTDRTKLTVAFDNFANAPTKKQAYGITILCVCGFVPIYTSNQATDSREKGMNIWLIENSPVTYKVQRN
jgi:hypothetical protein